MNNLPGVNYSRGRTVKFVADCVLEESYCDSRLQDVYEYTTEKENKYCSGSVDC